jgi:hypothetical protein
MAAQQVLAQAMPQILGTVKSQAVNASPDPMGAMVTRLIEPYLQQMMQQMMGSFVGGFGMPGMGMTPPAGQSMAGQQSTAPGFQAGPQPQQGNQPGSVRGISDEEFEEAWK